MLFAFDLDGTIVTHDKQFPEAIRAAILATRDLGHVVTVITGRHLRGTQVVLDALGIDCHYGTCQGARVHALGDEHHVELHLEDEVVAHLLERVRKDTSVEFFLSTRDQMFVRDPQHEGWAWARTEGRDVQPHDAYAGEKAHKFILIGDEAPRLHAELRERYPHLEYYLWHGRYLEVVAAGGTKGSALARLAALHGIAREDTVAFGDGVNDISMLAWAGHAVGVGQLSPGVAEVIDEHIPGPEDLGVARWLQEHVLNAQPMPQPVTEQPATK